MISRMQILAATVVVAAGAGGAAWINRMNVDAGAAAVLGDLESLPIQLGDFHGIDVPLDERLERHIRAESIVDRIYIDSRGREVAVHAAAFTSVEARMWHHPEVCYRNAGWTIDSTTAVSDSDKLHYTIMHCAKPAEPTVVYFWYQIGNHTAADWPQLREAFLSYRGTGELRPPIVKVMLHASGNQEDTNRALRDMARLLQPWISDFR